MTHCWRHPKYYKELRKIRATSFKQQAPEDQPQATSKPEPEPSSGPGSQKPQATSSKLQASSHKR